MVKSSEANNASSELQKLRDSIIWMDCLSQNGLSEIASIAKLALSRLETPDGYRNLDDIANALTVISVLAEDTQNCINSQAEDVGCHYIDVARRRRQEAQATAKSKSSATRS